MDSLSDSDVSDLEVSPGGIVVTKVLDVDCGLVNIRGWTDHITRGRLALFTVLDENTQSRWFSLVGYPSIWNGNGEPLELPVSRSAIAHPISVTMELLREIRSVRGRVGESGSRHFTVDSATTYVALETLGSATCGRFRSLLSRAKLEMTKELDCGLQTILIHVEWRSFNRARVRLTRLTPGVHRWLIMVSQLDNSSQKRLFMIAVSYDETLFEFPFDFTAGQVYHIEAFGLGPYDGKVLCQNYTDCRAELTLSDLQSLYDKARSFAGSRSAPCVWLYRNKPPKYFEDILLNRGGIMEVYLKDNSGDPGSPINGRIHGLFFMASVQRGSQTGEPDRRSAFGSCRLRIAVQDLLQTAPNLYFADFYCMKSNRIHYVTLVMTKRGSFTDRFCANRLVSLSVVYPNCNPFLFEDFSGEFRVSAKNNLFVEVLYTEDIDVRDYKLDHGVRTFGKGRSTKGGRPKNVTCERCSLMVRQTVDLSCAEPYALLML